MKLRLLLFTMAMIRLCHVERERADLPWSIPRHAGISQWVSDNEWLLSSGSGRHLALDSEGFLKGGDHRTVMPGFGVKLSKSESGLHHLPAGRSWASFCTSPPHIPHLYKRDNNSTDLKLHLCEVPGPKGVCPASSLPLPSHPLP